MAARATTPTALLPVFPEARGSLGGSRAPALAYDQLRRLILAAGFEMLEERRLARVRVRVSGQWEGSGSGSGLGSGGCRASITTCQASSRGASTLASTGRRDPQRSTPADGAR
eukprot:scaffold22242_cov41-Phaeocystis_antarctica.AAC.1